VRYRPTLRPTYGDLASDLQRGAKQEPIRAGPIRAVDQPANARWFTSRSAVYATKSFQVCGTTREIFQAPSRNGRDQPSTTTRRSPSTRPEPFDPRGTRDDRSMPRGVFGLNGRRDRRVSAVHRLVQTSAPLRMTPASAASSKARHATPTVPPHPVPGRGTRIPATVPSPISGGIRTSVGPAAESGTGAPVGSMRGVRLMTVETRIGSP